MASDSAESEEPIDVSQTQSDLPPDIVIYTRIVSVETKKNLRVRLEGIDACGGNDSNSLLALHMLDSTHVELEAPSLHMWLCLVQNVLKFVPARPLATTWDIESHSDGTVSLGRDGAVLAVTPSGLEMIQGEATSASRFHLVALDGSQDIPNAEGVSSASDSLSTKSGNESGSSDESL